MEVIIRNVSKDLDNIEILHNINLTVEDRSCMGLVGPDGSGKTTLIRLILGFYQPKQGEILFDRKKKSRSSLICEDIRVAFILHSTGLMRKLNVAENIELYHRIYYRNAEPVRRKEAVDRILKLIGLYDYRDADIDTLSKSMRQRLAIGRTMAANPKLLVMDEPYSGLDPDVQSFLTEYIQELKEMGCTVIISACDLTNMELVCDDIAFMNSGRIIKVAGIPKAFSMSSLEEMYRKYC